MGASNMRKFFLVLSCTTLVFALNVESLAQRIPDCVIVTSRNASAQEQLAAKEVRRYVYLRTGRLLGIEHADKLQAKAKKAIVVGTKQSPLLQQLDQALAARLTGLKPEEFLLHTITSGGRTVVVIAGGNETGTLYGAYR
ncbi:hypothetical protein EHM92_08085, partial [bacterium]